MTHLDQHTERVAARLIWWSLAAWLLTRALAVAVTVVSVPGSGPTRLVAWAFWDAKFYGAIARFGYQPARPWLAAYWPLYPLVMRPLLALPDLSWKLAALLVANVAALIALIFVGLLIWHETRSERSAVWGMMALAVSPLGVFLTGMYSDSLFLALAAGALLAARSQHWRWAGVALALGIVTRPFGVALALALGVEFLWQRRSWRKSWRDALWLIIPPLLTLSAFLSALWCVYGDPLITFREESAVFSHTLRWPWQTLALAAHQMAAAPTGSYAQLHLLIDLTPVLATLVTALLLARRWSPAFTIYLLLVALLCLITPIVYPHGAQDALASDGRYCYAAAPVLLIPIGRILARWPRLSGLAPLALSLVAQVALTMFVLHGGWLI